MRLPALHNIRYAPKARTILELLRGPRAPELESFHRSLARADR
jgi:hypothetical protein